jgi:UDP-GlcNAc:undecaprenyl-phosphate/decaprenyl-phosphate GlcNAc-1-phosphate transferase
VNFITEIGVFLGAALLSGLIVLASIHLAHRVNFLDAPDSARKSQSRPIPKLGGVAVALAFSLVVLVVLLASSQKGGISLAAGVLLPALGLAAVGFFDDKNNLNPYLRLFLQASVALIAWLLGTQIELTGLPILDAGLFVLWVMVIVNGVNLLDNSDGLAASTVLVSAITASIIATLFGQQLVSLLAVALAGVSAGFLFHNWFPARVYMGDSGAYFLGFLLAILAVRLRPEGVPPWSGVSIALLLVALPLADTFYVVTKRILNGIHPFTAGRDHLSHLLQENGHTVPGSGLLLQGISIAGASSAILIALVTR